jgi:hypothetical protein
MTTSSLVGFENTLAYLDASVINQKVVGLAPASDLSVERVAPHVGDGARTVERREGGHQLERLVLADRGRAVTRAGANLMNTFQP